MSGPGLRLPFERPVSGDGPWAAERFELSETARCALTEICASESLDAAAVLLGALQVLLHRYSGRRDVSVFVEGVPRRLVTAELAGHARARGALRRAAAAMSGPGDAGPVGWSSVVLACPGPSQPAAHAPDDALRLTFTAPPERLHGRADYRRDKLTATEVRRLLGHLERILTELASRPEASLRELGLLTAAEEALIHGTWNNTARDGPDVELVHELIARRARATPAAVAVTAGGQELRYHELLARAQAFAEVLYGAGVRQGEVVGLCLERSCDLVAGLLGILTAGAAYLPLDLDYPPERLAYMVRDSGARVVVTQRTLLEHLRATVRADTAIVLTEEVAATPAKTLTGGAAALSPQTPAYVLYTSGSTGRPKGVVVPHRAVANLYAGAWSRLDLGSREVVLALTTLSFDISVLEVLLSLMAGARIHLVDRAVAADAPALAAEITRSGVTFVQATPTTYRMLLTAGWAGDPELVLLCGGEALAPDLAEQLLSRCRRLWNGYGPTEVTVYSLVEPISAATPVTIGRPLANLRAYVLDEALNLLPARVPGELYLAGAGLAHGYLGRPDLTAERFLPDPFSTAPGGRLYRTGDLVCWTEDGRLEYLGRLDHQVKLRGYRIEPGEVEAALRAHPAVSDAVAAVIAHPGAEPVLTAFLTLRPGTAPTREELRELLGRTLPEFMIPTRFAVLDAFPLTPSRKVDRAGVLALGEQARPLETRERRAPRTPLEQVILGVWQDLMGTDDLGVVEPVFDAGADSLTAQRAAGALSEIFGVFMPVRALFDAPTVAAQAELLGLHDEATLVADRLLSLTGARALVEEGQQ